MYIDRSRVGESARGLDANETRIRHCDCSRVGESVEVVDADAVSICYCDCSRVGESAITHDACGAVRVLYIDCTSGIVGNGAADLV